MSEKNKEELTILTWNIDARPEDREARLATMARLINLHKPDVLCLQEVWEGSVEYLSDKTGLELAIQYQCDKNKFGNAILVKNTVTILEEPSSIEFQSVGENGKKSNLISIVVQSQTGRKWNVLTSHLAWGGMSEYARAKQVREIEAYASSLANRHKDEEMVQVVTGDFNTTPASDSIRYLKGLTDATPGAIWLDAWELSGDGSEGYTSTQDNPMAVSIAKKFNGVTKTEYLPKRRIDFIMVRGWRYGMPGYPTWTRLLGETEVSVLNREAYPSDHYGLVTRLWNPPLR